MENNNLADVMTRLSEQKAFSDKEGISKRGYFIGCALQGLCASQVEGMTPEAITSQAIAIADLLIEKIAKDML